MEVMDNFGQTPLSIAEGIITTGIVDFTNQETVGNPSRDFESPT
jgi:hypothetical protein